MTSDAILERLKAFSLFTEIAQDRERLKIIAEIMKHETAKAGEYLFKEGDAGDELYLLLKGEVEITKHTSQQEEYTIVDFTEKDNVFFGEMALLDEDVRSASILLKKDCEFLTINRADFVELGKKHPGICLPITQVINKILCGRLRRANNDVILLFDALVEEVQANQL